MHADDVDTGLTPGAIRRLSCMRAMLFDGTRAQPCSLEQVKAAANQPGIAWIDIIAQPGDADAMAPLLQAAGVDASVAQLLTQPDRTDFVVTPTSIHGVCWIAGDVNAAAQRVVFEWNEMRLVTLRGGGDESISTVQQRVTERLAVIRKDPSTLLGVVLQFMLATLQQGLTQTMIGVGALDLEIIATSSPSPQQSERLGQYRSQFNPVALRFPMYLVNVQTALIDTGNVAGLTEAGMGQLQQFASAAQSTGGLIDNLVSAIRDAAQDIQAQVGSWQSNRINVLTIVTMIFLPITFLTGYFGMNFSWLDDQLDSFASWIVLGVAVPILLVVGCTVLLASSGYTVPRLFRRRRRDATTSPS